jgi:MSHA biogenesis protein MshN
MSVINRMLQDLDARAGRAEGMADALPPAVTVVRERPTPPRVLLIALALVLAVALGIALCLARAPVSKPVAVAAAPKPVVKTIVLAPVPMPVPVPALAPSPEITPEAVLAEAAPVAVPKAEPKPMAAAPASEVAKPVIAAAPSVGGATRTDSPYRRALNDLAAGRKADAIAALEQALQADPRNSAARETLVGLLIEARRADEAMAQLQAALALDARQPALAMLLARLQIERGGDGIDTLLRGLPFAGSAADGGAAYHAFLAGALQRSSRHREAIAEYQAALQLAPDNGIWWMGLGLSLRADGQAAPSADAFRRARASGLPPELDAFVARQQ